MTRVQDLARAVAAAILGALLGAACVVAGYLLAPDLVMGMDTDPPPVVRGLYPVERGPDGVSYAWSQDHATITLPGLDRQQQWQFRLRFRGGREDPRTLPFVQTLVDDAAMDRRQATNQFQEVAVMLPTTDGQQRGARITVRCSNTFVPGPGDTRQLGIIIDEMRIVRLSNGVPFVPRPALAASTLGGAIFGAFFGLIGLTAGGAAIAVAALAAGQGIALAHGAGPYSPAYTSLVPWIAAWVAVLAALAVSLTQRWMGQRLRNTARFALAFTVGALYLKLLVLTHPSMPVGDALFQAHRFEWVRDGRYLFTSIAKGGYEFPYAIGLYLVALPFASLVHGTAGFMALLRFIATIADAAAGLLLYPMLTRHTGNRLAGAMAVAVFHLLPTNFQMQVTGKLTNVFAQSLLTACIATIVIGTRSTASRNGGALSRKDVGRLVLVLIGAIAAMLSHTGTAVLACVVMPLAAISIWWFDDVAWGRGVLVVSVVAMLVAGALYYGHFASGSLSQLGRIAVAMGRGEGSGSGRQLEAVPGDLDVSYGWPAVLLAIGGVIAVASRRDPLTLATAAWLGGSGLFLLLGLLTRIPVHVDFIALPAIALLAAQGAVFLWRAGSMALAVAAVLLTATVGYGIHSWIAPLR